MHPLLVASLTLLAAPAGPLVVKIDAPNGSAAPDDMHLETVVTDAAARISGYAVIPEAELSSALDAKRKTVGDKCPADAECAKLAEVHQRTTRMLTVRVGTVASHHLANLQLLNIAAVRAESSEMVKADSDAALEKAIAERITELFPKGHPDAIGEPDKRVVTVELTSLGTVPPELAKKVEAALVAAAAKGYGGPAKPSAEFLKALPEDKRAALASCKGRDCAIAVVTANLRATVAATLVRVGNRTSLGLTVSDALMPDHPLNATGFTATNDADVLPKVDAAVAALFGKAK